jgi:hypothetical protein
MRRVAIRKLLEWVPMISAYRMYSLLTVLIHAAWERYYMIWQLEPICITSKRVRRIASLVRTNYFAALVTVREHAIEFICWKQRNINTNILLKLLLYFSVSTLCGINGNIHVSTLCGTNGNIHVSTLCGINGNIHGPKSRQCLYIYSKRDRLWLVKLIDFKQ